jgi:enterochelin esterase family protein
MKKNWLQRAQTEGTPIVDGDQVTFFWQGASAPLLMGDFSDWERGLLKMEKAGKDTWIYSLRFPVDAYIEYAFLAGEERLPDRFNPRRTPTGMGKYNHYFYMPQGKPAPWANARKRKDIPSGTLTRIAVPCDGMVAGKQRTVYLYQPAAPGPYPLLVVWDGKDYLKRARLPQMVDALIAQERIQPIAMALVENGGWARWMEYVCSESTLGFLQSRVLPLAQAQLNLVSPEKSPGVYGVLGASMGGLMAMYTGLRLPQIFGRVLSQSGAFRVKDKWEMLAMDLVRMCPPQGQRIWMDVGLYDIPILLPANRRMRELLEVGGYDFAYREYPAGHNYPAWRDDVWRGLEYCFPVQE